MNDLAGTLSDLGYENLFMRLDSADLDRVWSEPGAAERLRELVLNPAAAVGPRFLAAEVLFARAPNFPPDELHSALASVYGRALAMAEVANPWGLPGETDGAAGQHLLQLGDAAIDPLIELLDDGRRVVYSGSKEATFGNSYAYRVKDLAAFYLSQLTGLPYAVHERPANRDFEIGSLRKTIRERRDGGRT